MNPTIRGHKGTFRVFENGELKNLINVLSVEVNQDSTFMRSSYVGDPVPKGDQSIEGWSGTAEMEVGDDEVEKFIDALISNNLNGIGISDYTFVISEEYANGMSSSYVYFDVQWKLSRRQSGQNEKVTKRLEFQASARVRV